MNHLATTATRLAALENVIRSLHRRIAAQGQEEARLHEQCKRLAEDLQRMQETCDGQRKRIYELECENARLRSKPTEEPRE